MCLYLVYQILNIFLSVVWSLVVVTRSTCAYTVNLIPHAFSTPVVEHVVVNNCHFRYLERRQPRHPCPLVVQPFQNV